MNKYYKKVLLIDDMRSPSQVTTDTLITVSRTYESGLYALKNLGPWDVLYLDHDLGQEETGYDIAKFLEEHTKFLPKEVYCVSDNPVGRSNINLAIKNAYKIKDKNIRFTDGKVIC